MTTKPHVFGRLSTLPRTTSSCRICGHQPREYYHDQNIGPVKFWDADDGWTIAALCPDCYADYGHDQPKPGDYAYDLAEEYPEIETDEDATLALF